MANLNKIVYLSEEQKNTLFTNGSVTANGVTITYNPNDLYITPPAYDAVPTENSLNLITSGAVYSALNSLEDANTTYTFTDGTNGFTVTPSGGTAQTVNVTPSIANNITGSGTNGSLTKFNGTNTITNGPALSAAVSSQTQTTKFLREDGTWAAPSYTTNTNTDTLVKQTAKSDNVNYKILTTTSASPTSGNAAEAAYDTDITLNPSTNTITATNFAGNASTATSASKLQNTAKIGDTNKPVYFTASGVPAAISYTIETSVPSGAVFTDTKVTAVGNHYAPSADTNSQLTASASGATAAWSIDVVKAVQLQRDAKGHVTGVTVTSGKIPANPNTDTLVKQNASTTNANYKLLLTTTASPTSGTAYEANYGANLTYNPSSNVLATGNLNLTGELDVTGNAYLRNETTIDSLTAGSILVNGAANFVQYPTAPTPTSGDNSTKVATTEFVTNSVAGLSGAMHFKGTTTTAIVDGSTTNPISIGGSNYTATAGDVVLREISTGNIFEYVWTGSAWEMLGRDTSFKVTQTAVSSPAASGNTTAFIDTISQDTNGNITVTKKNLDTSGTWSGTATKATQDGSGNNIVNTYATKAQLEALDAALTGTPGAGKTLTAFSQTDGKVTATFSDISITKSQVSDFPTAVSAFTNDAGYITSYTDTKNTAGSTDTTSKIFLIGATSQAASAQTYSDSEVYVQNGSLYLVKTQDLSGTANNKPALILGGADTSIHMELDANEIQAKTNGTSVAQLYINNDGGLVTIGSGGLAITGLTASQAVSTDANKKLVSTNLAVSDPTASGTGITYIASISQSAVGKITATKSTVRTASTSQTGVIQITTDNANSFLNQLSTGSSTPVDNDYYISQYVNGGTTTTTYHRRPVSALWTYIKGKITSDMPAMYAGNIQVANAVSYNTTPEVASIKIGNGTAAAAGAKSATLQYDATLETLNFVFT